MDGFSLSETASLPSCRYAVIALSQNRKRCFCANDVCVKMAEEEKTIRSSFIFPKGRTKQWKSLLLLLREMHLSLSRREKRLIREISHDCYALYSPEGQGECINRERCNQSRLWKWEPIENALKLSPLPVEKGFLLNEAIIVSFSAK